MSAVTLTKGVPVKLSKEDGSAVSLKSVIMVLLSMIKIINW